MNKTFILAGLIAVLPLNAALAHSTHTPGIDKRQAKQQERIVNGVRSGELTGRETYRLMNGQARVQRMENRAKRDGHVSRSERRRIHAAQNRQSRLIYNKKHNRRSYW